MELDIRSAYSQLTACQSNIAHCHFGDKWLLAINSIVFMVAGMLMLVLSWRTKKAQKQEVATDYYSLSYRRASGRDLREGLQFKTLFFDMLSATCLCKFDQS